MQDIFSDEQHISIETDLFGEYLSVEKFFWAVGVFSGNGAIETIKYALDAQLEIFFPHRLNQKGNFTPLWQNYLFIEYINPLTTMVCRQSSKFINFISFGNSKQPELIHKDSIEECLKLLKLGRYNYIMPRRPYIEKGTVVRIIKDENFEGKLVRLLCDIRPNMDINRKVPVQIGTVRMMIEIGKLFI